MKIDIIVAALPPQIDGIGDYTANLARHLAKSTQVKLLTNSAHVHEALPNVVIQPTFAPTEPRSVRALEPVVEFDGPDWVLLQYNPFSYGRWGLNLHLPLAIRRMKRRDPHLRFAIMVHEPFVRIQSLKFGVMASWQRWQLWSLGYSADAMFVSIELWTQELRRWFPGKRVVHLPVGSNIPLADIPRGVARQRLGIATDTVALGLFGSIFPGYSMPLIRETATAVANTGVPATVVYIGPDHALVRRNLDFVPILSEGHLSLEEVSYRFAAMDIYLAAFVDGVSTRRTSLMAALQHGVATVGTIGHNTDSLWLGESGQSLLLSPVSRPNEFTANVQRCADSAALRAELGRNAQELYQREFAWDVIATRILEAMW